jgi:hypothetical protein
VDLGRAGRSRPAQRDGGGAHRVIVTTSTTTAACASTCRVGGADGPTATATAIGATGVSSVTAAWATGISRVAGVPCVATTGAIDTANSHRPHPGQGRGVSGGHNSLLLFSLIFYVNYLRMN